MRKVPLRKTRAAKAFRARKLLLRSQEINIENMLKRGSRGGAIHPPRRTRNRVAQCGRVCHPSYPTPPTPASGVPARPRHRPSASHAISSHKTTLTLSKARIQATGAPSCSTPTADPQLALAATRRSRPTVRALDHLAWADDPAPRSAAEGHTRSSAPQALITRVSAGASVGCAGGGASSSAAVASAAGGGAGPMAAVGVAGGGAVRRDVGGAGGWRLAGRRL